MFVAPSWWGLQSPALPAGTSLIDSGS